MESLSSQIRRAHPPSHRNLTTLLRVRPGEPRLGQLVGANRPLSWRWDEHRWRCAEPRLPEARHHQPEAPVGPNRWASL